MHRHIKHTTKGNDTNIIKSTNITHARTLADPEVGARGELIEHHQAGVHVAELQHLLSFELLGFVVYWCGLSM